MARVIIDHMCIIMAVANQVEAKMAASLAKKKRIGGYSSALKVEQSFNVFVTETMF